MGRITGGEISYSETRKIAEYENKTAKCSLQFGFDDGEDYDTILSGIQAQAKHRVQVMLGLVKVETAKPLAAKAVRAPVEAELPLEDGEAVEPPKTRRGRRPKVEAVPVEEEIADEVEETLEEVEETDDLADLEEAAVEITDVDLTKAIAQKKEKLGEDGGVKLRKLIMKYAPKIPAIPQDKRADFLEQLKLLK